MIVYGGYNLSVDQVKAELNALGYSDKGNGVWITTGGYLTYVSAVKIRPVILQHTVSYDANGGTGAPASQTKTQGYTLTLSGTSPTRTGYTFQNWTASIGGNYSPSASYTHDQDGGTVTMTANWKDDIKPNISSVAATPSRWDSGNGTVSLTVKDEGSGLSSIILKRYSYVTETWSDVKSWTFSGTTDSVTKNYTEKDEGIFKYKVVAEDKSGNKKEKSSDKIYLDNSSPAISGVENTVTSWTKKAPVISVSATDYLSGTTYKGSGVKSISIKDAAGNVVASGTASASYTLTDSYQGTYNWIIEAVDNVGHTSSKTLSTKFDKTAPVSSIFQASPNTWSSGNGTVSLSVRDKKCGLISICIFKIYEYYQFLGRGKIMNI